MLRRLRFVVLLLPIAAIAQGPGTLLPLPPPPVPAGNPITPAKANLGKVLFWDEQLSSSRAVACGTCHRPEAAGTDPRSVVNDPTCANPGPDGIPGNDDDIAGSPGVVHAISGGIYDWATSFGITPQVTPRHAPTQVNSAYTPETFWDGRAKGVFLDPVTGDTVLSSGGALENQAIGPPLSIVEMGHVGRDWTAVTSRLASVKPLALAAYIPPALNTWLADRTYPQLFQEAFGTTDITPTRIALAIATYERTLVSNQAKIDSVIAGTAAFTQEEAQGNSLFISKQCRSCHATSLFTDNAFHYIGVRPTTEDVGRFAVTGSGIDDGAMKTPGLRNVELRSSFMHNGRFTTLEQVIDFYNRGGDFTAPNLSFQIVPLGLNATQKSALVAYMKTLTDPRVRNALPPFDRPTLFSEDTMVPVVTGAGVPGSGGLEPVPVAVEPPLSGNPEFTIGVYRALGGATARLVVDYTEPPADGTPGQDPPFAEFTMTLPGSGDGNGWGSATFAIPTDPLLIGQTLHARWFVDDPAAPNGLAASAAVSFKVFGNHGQGVLAVGPRPVALPRALRLAPGRPTPFASSTAIHYELYAASRVKLVVFDAQGRSIRRLVAGALQAPGPYAVLWDGRDDGGRTVSAGVYYYRLETENGAQAMRTVKID